MVQKTLKQLPKTHKVVLCSAIFMLVLFSLFPSENASASKHTDAHLLEIGKRYPLNVELSGNHSDHSEVLFTEEQNWIDIKVRKGDNLAKIFERAGLSPQETYRVSKSGKPAKKLLKMMPGQTLSVLLDENNDFSTLKYALSKSDTLIVQKSEDNKYHSEIVVGDIDTRLNYTQGEIENSFWNAGVKANMTNKQIMSLAGIFGWDIDFALELRQGDNFNVVFEEHYLDGEFLGFGEIVAAEFTNQGETFTAIRYEDGNYYTPEGRSMRKSFLRAPVNFSYISSSFNPRRFHPVQKRVKPHRGVDYAANRGTPVMAAGDGKVIKASYDKYNGHHVFIQHGEQYVTKYLHFTKRLVKRGQTVKQGQKIGTVGSTGMVTGAHLHYEFLVDGVHRNPRTVKLPKAKPIAKKDAEAFKQIASVRIGQLQNNKRIMLAMN